VVGRVLVLIAAGLDGVSRDPELPEEALDALARDAVLTEALGPVLTES
jgi:hypothetical protein